MFVRIALPLAAMVAAVLLLAACFGSGSDESAPGTASEPVTSGPSSTTAPTTVTEPNIGGSPTESMTVTGLADVPRTTEVGTDVLPKSAPVWKEEIADCGALAFRIAYDRELPAILVLRGDQVIAWAGLYRRDVSNECRDVRRKRPASINNESPPRGIYESVRLRCMTPGRIQIDAHAIEKSGSVYGSLIYVTAPGTPGWLVSAIVVKDVEGRRIYVNYNYCERY
jgi:hypothetical protein